MMQLSDGKTGTREFTAMVIFMIGIKFTDTTADILFKYGRNAAWMMPAISFVTMLVPLLILISLLKKHNNLGLIELVHKLAGKFAGFLIGFIMFLIMLSGTIINMRSYIDIVNTMYYPRTPIPILFLMLISATYFVANRGFETIGRVAWIILPYIQVIVIVLLAFVWQESSIMHIFPIAGPGFREVFSKSVSHSSIFGEMILLAAFFPNVRTHKEFRFAAILGFGIACLQIVVYLLVYIFVFDYPAVDQLVYPFHQLARAAAIGQTITNAEALFFGFWIISTVIHFAILLYLTVFLFSKALGMHEAEPLLMPFSWLVFLLGLIPENVIKGISFREILLQSSSAILIAVPFLLWILDKWKRQIKT